MPHTARVRREEEQDPVATVAAELEDLARRLVERAFKTLGKQDKLKLTTLSNLASEHFWDEWARDRTLALELLIRQAALELHGPFGAISKREAVFWLFNLDGGAFFPHVRKRELESLGIGLDKDGHPYRTKYDEIYDDLARRAGWKEKGKQRGKSTIRRDFRTLRRALAEIIIDGSAFTVNETERTQESRPVDEGCSHDEAFVRRPVLEAAISDAFNEAKILCLYGDGGTGKTTLAVNYARSRASEDGQVLEFSARDIDLFEYQICFTLDRYGIDYSTGNSTALRIKLMKLLCSSDAPTFVVIDDPPNSSFITALLDIGNPLSKMILTSRVNLLEARQGCGIQVGSMTVDEATSLLLLHAPQVQEDGAIFLARKLLGHVLATVAAAEFLAASDDITPEQFWRSTLEHPSTMFGSRSSEAETALLTIYKALLEQLTDRAPETLRILRSIACLDYERIPAWILAWELSEADQASPTGDLRDFAEIARSRREIRVPSAIEMEVCKRLLRTLENRSLISYDGDFVSIHPVTQQMMRALLIAGADDVSNLSNRLSLRLYREIGALPRIDADMLKIKNLSNHALAAGQIQEWFMYGLDEEEDWFDRNFWSQRYREL